MPGIERKGSGLSGGVRHGRHMQLGPARTHRPFAGTAIHARSAHLNSARIFARCVAATGFWQSRFSVRRRARGRHSVQAAPSEMPTRGGTLSPQQARIDRRMENELDDSLPLSGGNAGSDRSVRVGCSIPGPGIATLRGAGGPDRPQPDSNSTTLWDATGHS